MSKLTDDAHEWLMSFEAGRTFYNSKMKNSPVTEQLYTRWIKKYCGDLQAQGILQKTDLDELAMLKPTTDEAVDRAINHLPRIPANKADIVLTNYLADDDITPNIKKVISITVRSFYSANLRDLAKVTGKIDVPEAKQRSPSVDDCVKMEAQMDNARNSFLIWLVESTPMRADTLRQLVWGDIRPFDNPEFPFWVYVKGERLKGNNKNRYKGVFHVGFVHWLAAEKMKEYQNELKRLDIEVKPDSPVFVALHVNPHGADKGTALVNFFDCIKDASVAAFPDDKNKHYSIHDFRDLLSTVLASPKVKANPNLGKALLSHKAMGTEAFYENHKIDDKNPKPHPDHVELFRQCLPFLIPETTDTLKAELNEQKTKNAIEIEEMRAEMARVNKAIDELTAKMTADTARMKQLSAELESNETGHN